MGASHFSGPVVTGDKTSGETDGPNQGNVVLSQYVSIAQNSTTAVSATVYVPSGSQLLDFDVDVLTAFNSATSATLSIGIAAAGTEYAGSVNVKAATGRVGITHTAAQLAAMQNISVLGVAVATPVVPVVVTVTPVGATSAGYVTVTIRYVQK